MAHKSGKEAKKEVEGRMDKKGMKEERMKEHHKEVPKKKK